MLQSFPSPASPQSFPHHPVHDDDEHGNSGSLLPPRHRVPEGHPRSSDDGRGGGQTFRRKVQGGSEEQLEDKHRLDDT